MRKILLVFSLLITTAGYCQEKIQKFRAHSYINATYDEVPNASWQECNILIVLGKDKIKLYTGSYQELDIAKINSRSENATEITYDENAVDKFGNDIQILFVISKNYSETGNAPAVLSILYKNFVAMYRLYYTD